MINTSLAIFFFFLRTIPKEDSLKDFVSAFYWFWYYTEWNPHIWRPLSLKCLLFEFFIVLYFGFYGDLRPCHQNSCSLFTLYSYSHTRLSASWMMKNVMTHKCVNISKRDGVVLHPTNSHNSYVMKGTNTKESYQTQPVLMVLLKRNITHIEGAWKSFQSLMWV